MQSGRPAASLGPMPMPRCSVGAGSSLLYYVGCLSCWALPLLGCAPVVRGPGDAETEVRESTGQPQAGDGAGPGPDSDRNDTGGVDLSSAEGGGVAQRDEAEGAAREPEASDDPADKPAPAPENIPEEELAAACAPGTMANTWVQTGELPRKRGELASAVYEGKIYVFGGVHDSTTGPVEVDRFDPADQRWTQVAEMPEARNHITAGAAVYGDEVWLVGGKVNGVEAKGVARVDVFNLKTLTFRAGPELPEPHWAGPVVVVGTRLHVLTGAVNRMTGTDHHFVLDLTDEAAGWSSAAPVPEARIHPGGVAYRGKIWVLGGALQHAPGGDTNTVQVYDPAADRWEPGGELPGPRSHHDWSTFVYRDRIWSVSGIDTAYRPPGQTAIYRFDGDAWETWDELPAKMVSAGARVVEDVLYVFGGSVNFVFEGTMRDTWAYCLLD